MPAPRLTASSGSENSSPKGTQPWLPDEWSAESLGTEMEGYVYFIQQGEEGPLKIGWAVDPEKRLREFQTANPQTLFLRGAVPGSREDEANFHAFFWEHRIRGEWFQPCQCIFNQLADGERLPRYGNWSLKFDRHDPLRVLRFKDALEAPVGWGSGVTTPWAHDDEREISEAEWNEVRALIPSSRY